jgi:hypothetical protein
VCKASERIGKLQTAMMQLWESLGPEALASLDINPSEFEDYLANLQIAKVWILSSVLDLLNSTVIARDGFHVESHLRLFGNVINKKTFMTSRVLSDIHS